MKTYESSTGNTVRVDQPYMMRMDGHCFHTLTKDMRRPFDKRRTWVRSLSLSPHSLSLSLSLCGCVSLSLSLSLARSLFLALSLYVIRSRRSPKCRECHYILSAPHPSPPNHICLAAGLACLSHVCDTSVYNSPRSPSFSSTPSSSPPRHPPTFSDRGDGVHGGRPPRKVPGRYHSLHRK